MKLSLNYIKQYLDFDLPTDISELSDRIGSQLGEIDEAVVDLSLRYKDVLIARVVSCTPIEGSDHLNLCKIDDGNKQPNVERDEKGLVQVVCGASNVSEGQLVAWLPPGSVVPSSFNSQQFTLEARQVFDHTSYGMIASPKELDLSDDHDGILVIDKDLAAGDSFMKAYGLDDYIINIENKMFTHRPDCFGMIGLAREIAGIFNKPFHSPANYLNQDIASQATTKDFDIKNEIPRLCPRFSAVSIDAVKVKASPIEVQSYLSRLGVRPINNIVDATNLIMLTTGQPLHAYDYDKLKKLSGDKLEIMVRHPRPDESITLLNGKTLKASPQSIMIASGDHLIGLAGIMGSEIAEVDENTKTIILESASFDMYSIRRSSMELGVFSDSVTRFSKGQSPLQTRHVLASVCELILKLSPGSSVASEVKDYNHLPEETVKRDSVHPSITVSTEFINDRLGTKLSSDQMKDLLSNVECQVEVKDQDLVVKAPFWRTDLEIREDIVEEVGRLYGFQNIQPRPLSRTLQEPTTNKALKTKSRLRYILSRAGANEVLTYSFISRRLLDSVGQDQTKAFEIANSLSPELNYYRLSLMPSLLAKVHPNIKAGYDQFALFEVGTFHQVDIYSDEASTDPKEFNSVALVYAAKHQQAGAAYYKAKYLLEFLCKRLGIDELKYSPLAGVSDLDPKLVQEVKPYYDPKRSALLMTTKNEILGVIGEFKDQVTEKLKLPYYSSGFELDIDQLDKLSRPVKYQALSKFPELKQDLTLKTSTTLPFSELQDYLNQQIEERLDDTSFFSLSPLSIYKPKDTEDHINISFRLVIGNYQRTFSDEIVNKLLESVVEAAVNKFKVTRV